MRLAKGSQLGALCARSSLGTQGYTIHTYDTYNTYGKIARRRQISGRSHTIHTTLLNMRDHIQYIWWVLGTFLDLGFLFEFVRILTNFGWFMHDFPMV